MEARNPYKGLRPFTEVDAHDFHGRDALARRLLGRLREPAPAGRFLAIVGPSGAGKSSLVRAGLLPAIRDGALLPAQLTFVTELYPGSHPIDELEAALTRVAVRGDLRVSGSFGRHDRALLESVQRALPPAAELVLVVDQLEEVFTLTTDAAERDGFLEMLRVAVADRASRVRVIVTLRADFYDRPLLRPHFGELLAGRTEAVAPLAADELEAAIRQPAESVGARLELGLVSALIGDVAHQPGALPLLEYALTELFEGKTEDTLTLEGYHALGGLAGTLSTRADQLLAESSMRRADMPPGRSSCASSRWARAARTRADAWPAASCGPCRLIRPWWTMSSRHSVATGCSRSTATPPIASRPWRSPTRRS